jgi:hypothetical protein
MVKPEEGAIKYEEYSPKRADKFVHKVINGQVERIEISENKKLSRSAYQSPKKSS